MIKAFENFEIWWVTGAQLLYGGDAVVAVDGHSKEMVEGLNAGGIIPIKVVYKGTANSSKEVEDVMKAANNDAKCVGVITWMHTFSPAKMWIKGLQELRKPLLHFHTQYNAEIPWATMDMDFMNLNQSAHGDREFGHICARLRKPRKVVSGYWKDERPQKQIAVWARVAAAWADAHDMRILRFGDQMNNVAVTDGDKVEAEMRLGYHVDYYPVSSLMDYYKKVTDAEADELVEEYKKLYTIKIDECGEEVYWQKVHNAAKAEIALRRVLKDEGAKGFTTNFDDLGEADINDPNFLGFDQIPGLASQRLMQEGYGFGAEGVYAAASLIVSGVLIVTPSIPERGYYIAVVFAVMAAGFACYDWSFQLSDHLVMRVIAAGLSLFVLAQAGDTMLASYDIYTQTKAREAMILAEKEKGNMEISVPVIEMRYPLKANHYALVGLSDISVTDYNFWTNAALAQYYQVNSITGIPSDNTIHK